MDFSQHLQHGHAIPIRAMGRLPAGFLDALEVSHAMQWAPPAIFLTTLFLSDYATTIAFVGMDFETSPTQGPLQPILHLHRRNRQIPYQALGDPALPRTRSQLEGILALENDGNDETSSTTATTSTSSRTSTEEWMHLARQESMVSSFLLAADAMARGESPFLTRATAAAAGSDNDESSSWMQSDPTLLFIGQQPPFTEEHSTNDTSTSSGGGISWHHSTVLFANNNEDHIQKLRTTDNQENSPLLASSLSSPFLSAVPLALPLKCQQNDNMWEIIEERGQDGDFQITSRVPPCDFVAPRASGIHHSTEQATVTAYASTRQTALVYWEKPDKLLTHGFFFPMNGMPLARDRVGDVRQGRIVLGFDSVLYEEHRIPLVQTVVSAGVIQSTPTYEGEDAELKNGRDYTLVGMIDPENCPQDPSGGTASSSECMAIMALECDNFGPDRGTSFLQPHTCSLIQTELVWGQNWHVDEHLLAAVAGVYGRNSAWAAASLRQRRTLAIHVLPAAMFTMGSLDLAPSIELVKSTSIDVIFLVFMSFPVFLCLITGTIYLLHRNSIIPIPDDGYKMLALGRYRDAFPEGTGNSCNTDEADALYVALDGNKVVLTEKRATTTAQDDLAFQDDKGIPQSTKKMHLVPKVLKEHEVVDAAVLGDVDSDEISSQMEMARAKRGTLKRSDKTSLGRKPPVHSFGASRIWVISCMVISVLVVFVGGLWVGAKKEDGDASETTGLPPEGLSTNATGIDEFSKPNNNPSRCFASRAELHRAISFYFDGTPDSKDHLLAQYGQALGDWCVDYIGDFSFLFAERDLGNEDVSKWNVSQSQSFSYCFYGSSFDGDLGLWSVGNSWDFSGMFNLAYNFQGQGLSTWDVSRARNMAYMFFDAPSFDGNISTWQTGLVRDFSGTFSTGGIFNGDLSSWNVSSAKSMLDMFYEAFWFDGDLCRWDTSNVEIFRYMFDSAWAFNGNISTWDVRKAHDFSYMFFNAEAFEGDLSMWRPESGVSMRSMFQNSPAGGDFSGWAEHTGNVINFAEMFKNAGGEIFGLSNWDVSSGVYFFQMFHGSLFNEDISGWDVSEARELIFMFRSADDFDQNLCPWVDRLPENALTIDMFIYSGCDETHETSESAMCQWCIEDPPTPAPSSPAPTIFCDEANKFVLELKTDDFPEETSWDIMDSAGNEVAFGGDYDYNEDTLIEVRECLEAGNYTFTIYDAWGDGLCCIDDYADGWYSVIVGGQVVVSKGGKFGESSSVAFAVA